ENDYGILPIPKYDASQESFGTTVWPYSASLISVPNISANHEMTGVILEALSAESTYTVIPALYETVLKQKSARDEESIAMLEIIFDSMVFDAGLLYSMGGFANAFLRISGNSGGVKRTSDVASLYEKYTNKIDKHLEELIEVIESWN
ncbi:MAG: hypothetical protein J6I45_05830, partial [Clostridia bacterium]|nr:hypothetical protein [Clostridia bacterium]